MSAIVDKKLFSKKEDFKNYLLELLQEDYVFRHKIFKLLFEELPPSQPLRNRSKEEWKTLSAENKIEWADIEEIQKLFKSTD